MIKSVKNSTAKVKQTNVEIIKSIMRNQGTMTCAEISRISNLSIATCRTILNSLVESGDVTTGKFSIESGGRPAKTYIFNENHHLCMAITIDKNEEICEVVHSVFNLTGEICEKNVHTYEDVSADLIDSIVHDMKEKYPEISALCISIPGISDSNGVVTHNDIKTLDGVDFSEIALKYNLKYKVASSPDIIAYGYFKKHPELSSKPFAALYVPIDQIFGAGIILNDSIYKGFYNTAGEIGFLYHNNTDTIETIANAVSAMVTILSPQVLLVAGKGVNREMVEEIRKLICTASFFPVPDIVYEEDTSDLFLTGITSLAIDSLANNFKLIQV